MNIKATEEELANYIDNGISLYLHTLCGMIEEGVNWQEAEENFRHVLSERIAFAIKQAVIRGVAL
jgi:hypothetical protein